MTQTIQTPVRHRSSRRWIIPIFLLLLLFIMGGVTWLFFNPSEAIGLPPLVQIVSPSSGGMVEINTPLTIHASAEGTESFKRVELYSDGALVAVEDSTLDGGSNPLIFLQDYTPLTLGRHVLMARGYISDDNFTDSEVVYLDVLEPSTTPQTINVDTIPISNGALPSINDVSLLHGVPPDQLQGANPDLTGTDPSLPLPPGTSILIPPRPRNPASSGDTPPLTPLASAPAAPTALSLTLDCTSNQLSWTDNTTDETGFVVYRLAPGDSRLNRVATLPANTTTYSETFTTLGTYRYQVAAVRGRAEGLSLMQSAATPDVCAPTVTPIETIVLSVLSLDTTEAYEGVYCYFDINGSGYERAPETDFVYFTPQPDGLTYNLARQLPNHGQFVLGVPADGGALTFGGECWGQRGPISTQIGLPFTASHVRSDWDGRDLIQTAMDDQGKPVAALPSFQSSYNLRLVYRLSANTPAARSQAIASQFDLSHLDPSSLQPLLAPYFPEPIYGPDIFLPPFNLRVRNSCDAYGPPLTRARVECAFRTLGRGEPTLFWDWMPSGIFEERILTSYVLSLREIYHDGSSTPFSAAYNTGRPDSGPIPRRTVLQVGHLNCDSRIEIKMQAFISGIASPFSETITWLVNPACANSPQPQVAVSFRGLNIGSVNEGRPFDFRTDTLELNGSIRVNNATRWLVHGLDPNDDYWVDAGPGVHTFDSAPVPDPFFFTWPDPFSNIRPSRFDWGTVFFVNITRGSQTITISSDIYDVDPSWFAVGIDPNAANSGACGGRAEIGPLNLREWSTINRTLTLGGGVPTEQCTVTVTVTGAAR